MTPGRRAARARRIARAIVMWRLWPTSHALHDVPARYRTDAVWVQRHLLDPNANIAARRSAERARHPAGVVELVELDHREVLGYRAYCIDGWRGPAHLIDLEPAPRLAAITDAETHEMDEHPEAAA